MTSRPARPRALLDFISWPILKGVAPTGTLKRIFTGKLSPDTGKKYWESYLCVRNFSKLQKPYRPYRHFKKNCSRKQQSGSNSFATPPPPLPHSMLTQCCFSVQWNLFCKGNNIEKGEGRLRGDKLC